MEHGAHPRVQMQTRTHRGDATDVHDCFCCPEGVVHQGKEKPITNAPFDSLT